MQNIHSKRASIRQVSADWILLPFQHLFQCFRIAHADLNSAIRHNHRWCSGNAIGIGKFDNLVNRFFTTLFSFRFFKCSREISNCISFLFHRNNILPIDLYILM